MSSGGYIKLSRSLLSHPSWRSEPFTRGQAWVDMLLRTAYSPMFVRIRGVRVDLLPGQLALSEVEASARWQWSRGKVRRWLAELETLEHQIVQQKNNVTTLITVTNWTAYQGNGTADGTASSTANGQQTDTEKKEKKVKKEKKETPHTFKTWTEEEFRQEIREANDGEVLTTEQLHAFFAHWTEPDATGKPRRALEKTWKTRSRIQKWARNAKNWGQDEAPSPRGYTA